MNSRLNRFHRVWQAANLNQITEPNGTANYTCLVGILKKYLCALRV